MKRHRIRLAVLSAIAVCAAALAMHHSGMALGDRHHEGLNTAVEMCLAAFTAVGAAVASVVLGVIALGRWRPSLPRTVSLAASSAPPLPSARAGPRLLLLLCVSRR